MIFPFCFFHGSGRSLLRCYVLINLAAHTVINIRAILRKTGLLHLFPCISPRADCLCFESFHLIGRRHFTRNNSFEIFLQRKDIDQQSPSSHGRISILPLYTGIPYCLLIDGMPMPFSCSGIEIISLLPCRIFLPHIPSLLHPGKLSQNHDIQTENQNPVSTTLISGSDLCSFISPVAVLPYTHILFNSTTSKITFT